jgi:hypothetical protein
MKIAIVYLSYVPYGPICLENFLKSYIANKPNLNHSLHIVMNGWKNSKELKRQVLLFEEILKQYDVEHVKHYSLEDADIGVYLSVKKEIETDFFVFLNTRSTIINRYWLDYLFENITKPGVGAVGATGAWGDATLKKRMVKLLKKLIRLKVTHSELKQLFFYYTNLYPTLRPHLRTNAFMIKSEILQKLIYHKIRPFFIRPFAGVRQGKLRALCFEHGRQNMNFQLKSMRLRTLVVGSDGKGYEEAEWYDSNTFWSGEQENLIITDNQTEKYATARDSVRKFLRFSAWYK